MSSEKSKRVRLMAKLSNQECILTDWDDEGGEGIATHHTTIVHDVLRSHFPVDKEKESQECLLLNPSSAPCASFKFESLIA